MFLNKEFLRLYEELSSINGNINTHDSMSYLDEAFNNEEVYGEAAKTIPGLLRYFVAHIETLASVIERGRILVSTGESKKASDGKSNGKKLPFVSFSHQLFSHAYRRGSSWKYGIVVDQKRLEQKVQTLSNTNIEDNYVHENKSSRVFGAAKLSDGSEIIMTSYGQFEMDLDDSKRKALGDISKTGYYDKVKDSFNTRLAAEQEKYTDNHAKSLTAESFYCTEVPEVIKRYLKIDVDVLEGFLLVDRRQATGVRFTDVCSDVPGLFDYLQEHTTLNEGELRVWLPKGEKYLDVSGCIVGVVLPSNYKENNLDDSHNNADDVVWLRKLIKEKGLTMYVYKSNDEANIPSIDTSTKLAYKQQKQPLVSYFHNITRSREAAVDFIINEILPYQKIYKGYEQAYCSAVAKHTTSAIRDLLYMPPDYKYGYKAFLKAILEHDITEKDIMAIRKTGKPLQPAHKAFEEKTISKEAVQAFVKQLIIDFPMFSNNLRRAYNKWFVANTNALRLEGQDSIVPEEISWNSFIETCTQEFNYTSRDLSLIASGNQDAPDRRPIKELFKLATGPNPAAVKKFIKCLAKFSVDSSISFLSETYRRYIGYLAVDSSSTKVKTDPTFGYGAWLDKITDQDGPIKLTKEEVLAYFKECQLAAQNK